ncbi:aromatic amino acid lyase [Dongia sp.]|uniref:aromatic amino acid lyase n=1 Tax=Dongia sp. TaxID=1977262 RepID=UPI0035B1FAE0
MPLELNRRADLTLDAYRRVAWEGAGVRLGPVAQKAMAEARRAFIHLLDTDPDITVYGVTSGYGQHANKRFTGEARRSHAQRPPRSAAVAFGPPAPERVARGIVLARLANFIEGHAAITPALADRVAGLLDAALPQVSLSGQGGAGEILWMAPLIVDLAEEFPLGEKDALSLINGSPAASALIADAALAMRRRLDLAERVFALSAEAIKAPLEAYDAAFDGLWGDPYEAQALQRLRDLLAGGATERRPYQAPVSYRILPRVLGQMRRAVALAEEIAQGSLQSVTDNPVFLMPDAQHPRPRVYSNGGYHNARAYPALDNLGAAAADLCILAERHNTKLLDGRYSLLPDQLQAADEAYIGIVGFVQVGYAEQARRAAQRTFLPGSEAGGFGQNDVSPLTGLAWRGQEEVGQCLEAALAMLGVVASQAFHMTGRAAPPALAETLATIRRHFPPMTQSRVLGPDLKALADCFRAEIYRGVP